MSESVERGTEIAALEKIAEAMAEERAAEKRRFRLAALTRRDSLTAKQRKSYSDRIVKNLTNLPCYQDADAILTYVSFRSEADTFSLIERSFADGKAVFAPKVMGKEMDFYRFFSRADLTGGYRGILEPAGGQLFAEWISDQVSQFQNCQQERPLREREIQEHRSGIPSVMICIPGAAFDRERHRIGYGGGFYDRYLSGMPGNGKNMAEAAQPQVKFTTAALAFGCQIFETIPWEAHDICPERIVTETEIL